MIVLVWMSHNPSVGEPAMPGSMPRLLTVSDSKDEMVLIEDLTADLFFRIDGTESLSTNGSQSDTEIDTDVRSIKMLVVREKGEVESALRMDQGIVTAVLGMPIQTEQLSNALSQLQSLTSKLRVSNGYTSGKLVDIARILKNMEDLCDTLNARESSNQFDPTLA